MCVLIQPADKTAWTGPATAGGKDPWFQINFPTITTLPHPDSAGRRIVPFHLSITVLLEDRDQLGSLEVATIATPRASPGAASCA